MGYWTHSGFLLFAKFEKDTTSQIMFMVALFINYLQNESIAILNLSCFEIHSELECLPLPLV